MSKSDKGVEVSISVPERVKKARGMPKQIYLTFEKDPHKKSLMKCFEDYERTAVVRELAEFWFPKIITEVKKAMEKGAESIKFTLAPADED